MKILDSDTCLGLLRRRADVLDRCQTETDEVATTWVTAAELFYGAARSARPEQNAALVVQLLHTLPVLEPDLASARLFGAIKATLAAEGQIVADADLFIAAIALTHNATLVTGNRRHYARIPGLRQEDWLRP
jgi:tRNA(fMet)-specific endonuclease VapC